MAHRKLPLSSWSQGGRQVGREGGTALWKPPLSLSSPVAWRSRREEGSVNREGGSELDASMVVVSESSSNSSNESSGESSGERSNRRNSAEEQRGEKGE